MCGRWNRPCRLVAVWLRAIPYTMGRALRGDSFIKLAYDLSRAYVDSFIKCAYLYMLPLISPAPNVRCFSSLRASLGHVLARHPGRQHDMPRRGSHADRLLPVASCLLTFALALSVRMFWALPPETEPVAAPTSPGQRLGEYPLNATTQEAKVGYRCRRPQNERRWSG